MRRFAALTLTLGLIFALGCNSNSPNNSNGKNQPLAGGGRYDSEDPADGSRDSLGPILPDPDPYPGLWAIYSADRDCADNPRQLIISDSATWAAWWEEVAGCQWRGWFPDSTMGDTGCDRCNTDPPYIDFASGYVVAAISVEYDSGSFCHRSVWINSIESDQSGTTISYDVSRLDETCCMMIMAPMMIMGYSPVVAVVTQGPLTEPIVWNRRDTTYSCWVPDPNEPMTLFYTDGVCDLGEQEQVITDNDRWEAWFTAAVACHSPRYDTLPGPDPYPWDSLIIGPEGDTLDPANPDSGWTDPWWGTPEVDFSKHAVIILRAGEQDRWGGGVWLDEIDRTGGGTRFAYTVMVPDADCPAPEPAIMLNPTVAIRIPLPVDLPVIWERSTSSIGCGWITDSSLVDPNGNMGPR